MKLRTVLSELPITAYRVHAPQQLDWDVVVAPVAYRGRGSEGVICLGSQDDLALQGAPGEGKGLLLVYVKGEPDEGLGKPDRSVVYAFGQVGEGDFRAAFARLVARCGVLAVRRERLFKAYLASYDIKQFASHAAEILDNPLVISNADRKVLAFAGDLPRGSAQIEAVLSSGYVTDEVTTLMEADGFLRAVRDARRPVISEGGTTGVRNVSAIIYHHHLDMGRLDVFEVRPMTGLDLELVDYASSLAGIMIDRLGVAGERVGMGSTVFSDLLSGRLASVDAMRALVSTLGVSDGGRFALVSVVGEQGADRDYYLKAGQVLQGCLRHSVWTLHGDSIVILIPLGKSEATGFDDYDRCERRVLGNRQLCDLLDNNDMQAYVCEPYEDLAASGGMLRQCEELAEALGEAQDGGASRVHFFWHERFLVMGHYAKADGRLGTLLDQRVVAMADYDRRRGTSYLSTAVMSVRYPGEPVVAAEALSVHRNTYFYRVNKIRDLFYLDLKDGDDRLAVAFTAHLMDLG